MRPIKNTGGNTDLRDMLLAAGVGNYNAALGIQMMNFLPMTTDPYAQGTIQIVQGLQRLLNKRGARLDVDGRMGEPTVHALMKYAGPRWYDKSWSQIYGDVMDGRVWDGWFRESRVKYPLSPGGEAFGGLGMVRFSSDSPSLGHTAYHHLGADDVLPPVVMVNVTPYCSVAHPWQGCTGVAGIAKPMDGTTLGLFQNLQRMINAILAKQGKKLIDVDGRIGPATIDAMGSVNPVWAIPYAITIDSVAQQATQYWNELFTLADSIGATTVPDPVPKSPPSVAGPGNTVVNPPDSAIAGGLTALLQNPLALAAVAIGGLLLMSGGSKPKRRSKNRRKRGS